MFRGWNLSIIWLSVISSALVGSDLTPLQMRDKGIHTFPNDISPKVNIIARLEFNIVS